jgi:hypothetical protein
MKQGRDVDSAELAFRMRAGGYAIIIGMVGAGIGLLVFAGSTGGLLLGLLCGVAAAAVVYFGTLTLAEHGGRVASSIYQPSGSSTPAVREYSFADSLVARGHFQQAVETYEQLAIEHADDPEPRLRQARVLRDHLGAHEQAATAFKKVLQISTLKPEIELRTARELVELYLHKQRNPQMAMPHLARIAENYKGTPTGDWARAELMDIKQSLQL